MITTFIMAGLLATVLALATGIYSMAHGGEHDQVHSHRLMFARVGLQGVTVLFLLLALLSNVD